MSVTLRSRAPFTCRGKNPDGSFRHADRPLKEDEGKVCAECATKDAEIRRRFFEAPVKPPEPAQAAAPTPRIWPE